MAGRFWGHGLLEVQSLYFVHTNAEYLLGLRLPLLKALSAYGYRVTVMAPALDECHRQRLLDHGIDSAPYRVSATGRNPIADICTAVELYRIFKRERPDVVFCNNIKPVVFGTLAAALAGVRGRPVLVGGLGYAFTMGDERGDRIRRLVVRVVASILYAVSFRLATSVIFHNADDLALLKRLRICPSKKGVVVPGSGVDVDEFRHQGHGHTPSFVFVGRMLKDKGVREFMEAASLVKKRFPEARFRMIGGIDKNPAAVSQEEIEAGADAGDIEWVGHVEDVRPFMEGFSVFVLPSYREGVPRSTLEAMALGKAIVTTDAPGCRETVIDGVNGFLVPPRNGTHLADVLMRFCEDISLAERFGAESRKMAIERFSVERVNSLVLDAVRRG